MLRRAPILVFFMALAMLISCTPQNAGPDVVRVHFSDGTPKMIGYDGSTALNGSVSIDSYRVGVQPSGGSVTYSDWFGGETNTYDITGLVVGGSYTISVDGAIAMKEGDPIIISKASSPYTVKSGTNDVYLELSDFVDGEAESLTVTLTPPSSADDASAVTYTGSLQSMAGVEQASAAASGTTLTFTSADHDLTAGLFLLTVTATEGDREWKATEVVRLLPGLPATGTMAFKGEDGVDVDVSFDDQMGRVIMFAGEDGVSMDGTEVTATVGSDVAVDFTGTDAGADDVTMRIYVNGIQLSEGAGYTKSGAVYTLDSTVKGFIEGRNVVTFMASNGKPFGVGSMDYIINLGDVKLVSPILLYNHVVLGKSPSWNVQNTDKFPDGTQILISTEEDLRSSSANFSGTLTKRNDIFEVDLEIQNDIQVYFGAICNGYEDSLVQGPYYLRSSRDGNGPSYLGNWYDESFEKLEAPDPSVGMGRYDISINNVFNYSEDVIFEYGFCASAGYDNLVDQIESGNAPSSISAENLNSGVLFGNNTYDYFVVRAVAPGYNPSEIISLGL